MAVYTKISNDELESFLAQYDLGVLHSYEGIEQGVSNSIYRLRTDQGLFVLTIFEPRRVQEEDIPFFLSYAVALESAGIPCPKVFATKTGHHVSTLAEKPAAIFSFLSGSVGHPDMITPDICRQVGALNARMHKAVEGFDQEQENHFGPACWDRWYTDMEQRFDEIEPGLASLLSAEMTFLKTNWPGDLPSGAIHGDLFEDNVFFENGQMSGVIDFHFVCTDFFAYDLATTLNAWCFHHDDKMNAECFKAMMEGYNTERPLTPAETAAMPVLLRGVAVRYLLSRAEELLAHRPEDLMVPKDPKEYVRKLRYFQDHDLLEAA